MVDVYVAVGSNIEPLARLREALELLHRRFAGLRPSPVYRSPPYGFTGPDFLNMVVAFACTMPTPRLIEALDDIERRGGRVERAGSRTLDLDLLLYGARVDARQRLPRSDVLRYPFVLAPLAELSGSLVHPVTGATMADAWADMQSRNLPLERLGPIDSL
jgi:2-amino-4-hydroxy-6-hydroxymethyldihydropteridine diphosphokinase